MARRLVGEYGGEWRREWRGCWARPQQLAPEGEWQIWLYLGGRGSGKTRAGAEWVKEQVGLGRAKWVALVARTAADARDVLVEGESGILSVYSAKDRPIYEPSKRRLTWANGAQATTYSAEEPDSLRGPQHDLAWCDELAAWGDPDAWNQLLLGLRLGRDPRVAVTTTPRPSPLIRRLLSDRTCVVQRGSTYDNKANLAGSFMEQVIGRYEGTRLGAQEIYAEVLEDGAALWTRERIDGSRVEQAPELAACAVGVDPSAGDKDGNDEQGIGTCGLAEGGRLYVLEDGTVKLSPAGWGHAAVMAAVRCVPRATVVVETNCGGAMAAHVIRTAAEAAGVRGLRVEEVNAKRGKHVRAEPVSALWEQGRASMVGRHEQLEEELLGFTADGYIGAKSPNRADAMIWAATWLEGMRHRGATLRRASGLSEIG